MCAISSLTSTFAISSPDKFLYIYGRPLTEIASFCVEFVNKFWYLLFLLEPVFVLIISCYHPYLAPDSRRGSWEDNVHYDITKVETEVARWRNGYRALDLQSAVGSNPTRGKSRVTTLGKLFTPMCLCHCKQYNVVPAKWRWCSAAGKVTEGLTENNGSLLPGGWLIITWVLIACTPGSAPGPTLGTVEN